jgi:hypothetical protein
LRERRRRLVAHVTDVEPHTTIVEGALLQTPKNATGK